MKIFLFLTLVTAIIVNTSATPLIDQRNLNPNAVIHQIFEVFRNAIKFGSIENNSPILDPISCFKDDINIQNTALSFKANLKNSELTGLGDFQIKNVAFLRHEVAIDLQLIFPKLVLDSENYHMEGIIFGAIPLLGEGRLRIEIIDLEIVGRLYLVPSESGNSTLIKKFENTQFNVRKVLSYTEFDGNIDCIFNSIVKDMLATYINRFSKYIVKTNIKTVLYNLNLFLNKFETWRLISSLL